MDQWFQKLNSRREPLGLETSLLRWMPKILVIGTLGHCVLAAVTRLWFGAESAKTIMSIDIFLIASLITFLTAVVTVTIACFIVFVMKGPAYVADAYPLNEASRPRD
jgi:hypothetical protein